MCFKLGLLVICLLKWPRNPNLKDMTSCAKDSKMLSSTHKWSTAYSEGPSTSNQRGWGFSTPRGCHFWILGRECRGGVYHIKKIIMSCTNFLYANHVPVSLFSFFTLSTPELGKEREDNRKEQVWEVRETTVGPNITFFFWITLVSRPAYPHLD